MKRRVATDGRYTKKIWSKEQKLQAVSTWLMLGNMAQTSVVTSIPLQTLKAWKATTWFKEYCLELQADDIQEMDSKMKRVVEKALRSVEDRLDFGDAVFDQRTGAIQRIPVKAVVALKITTDLLKQQQLAKDVPMREEDKATVDDRLLRLAEEFSNFAKNKIKIKNTVIDVATVEIKTGE